MRLFNQLIELIVPSLILRHHKTRERDFLQTVVMVAVCLVMVMQEPDGPRCWCLRRTEVLHPFELKQNSFVNFCKGSHGDAASLTEIIHTQYKQLTQLLWNKNPIEHRNKPNQIFQFFHLTTLTFAKWTSDLQLIWLFKPLFEYINPRINNTVLLGTIMDTFKKHPKHLERHH